MPLDERKQIIMSVLSDKKTISLNELGEILHYSQATLRRDVALLESEGLLQRTHGKIHWVDSITNIVPSTRDRSMINLHSKRMIAQRAAELIPDGSTVILDSGTTTSELARALTSKSITVVTNSLETALILSQSNSQVISCGGLLQPNHLCFLGPDAERFFSTIEVDILFLGTSGVRRSYGLTTSSPLQYNIKQAMINAAKKKVALFDLSKLDAACLFAFSNFSDLDVIVTMQPQPGSCEESILNEIREKGIEVICADDSEKQYK